MGISRESRWLVWIVRGMTLRIALCSSIHAGTNCSAGYVPWLRGRGIQLTLGNQPHRGHRWGGVGGGLKSGGARAFQGSRSQQSSHSTCQHCRCCCRPATTQYRSLPQPTLGHHGISVDIGNAIDEPQEAQAGASLVEAYLVLRRWQTSHFSHPQCRPPTIAWCLRNTTAAP